MLCVVVHAAVLLQLILLTMHDIKCASSKVLSNINLNIMNEMNEDDEAD